MQYQGFGNGSAGPLNITSNTTESPIDSACAGSSGGTSLSATNASFAPEQMILIHQTQGTGHGSWELNFIDEYTAGTITTLFDLANNYSITGSNKAQVRTVPEYSSITIAAGVTWTGKAWTGTVGGLLAYACNGHVQINGTMSVKGTGFRGGTGTNGQGGGSSQLGFKGEGFNSFTGQGQAANGNGGGGGEGGDGGSGGGGGGNGTAGTTGQNNQGAPGVGGSVAGNAALTLLDLGGGGGGGRGESNMNTGSWKAGNGGRGGGAIFGWQQSITVNATTGFIDLRGDDGQNSTGSHEEGSGGGGGGSGGSGYFVGGDANFGTNRVLCSGGVGGQNSNLSRPGDGGAGGQGRFRAAFCNYATASISSGQTSLETGGHDYCQSFISIY